MNAEDAEEYTQALGQVVAGGWRQVALGERLGVPKALGLSTRDWVEQRLGGYVRMNIAERREAAKELREGGLEQPEIAEILGVSQPTISRDLTPPPAHSDEYDTGGSLTEEQAEEVTPPPAHSDEYDTGPISDLPEPEPLGVMATLVAQGLDEKAKARAKARERTPEPVAEPVPPPPGRYRCIIIDPPWPMQKIERDTHPEQGLYLDYPVMALEDIADERHVPVRSLADDDCHVYLWVTQKYLPAGLELLEAWGFNYQCVMTWRKNVGFTPFSWMYDTEHVLFGRRGNLPLLRMGLRLSFDAPVQGHSAKPDVFYERVTEASPGPRVEMFARRERDGFVPWGNEVDDAARSGA